MIMGIVAAVLLVGVTLGNLPRTVYSAAYSESETEPAVTEVPVVQEEITPELYKLEPVKSAPTEPESTEPEPTEPESTEPEPAGKAVPSDVPETHETDLWILNGAGVMTREIDGNIRMSVVENEAFPEMMIRRRTEPRDEGWICPLTRQTYVSSPFGYRWHPVYGTYRMHKGVDLRSDWYDHIVATRSGTVIARGYDRSAGYYVKIDHGNGFVSEYFHLADYYVYVGQSVEQGELIALVGSTGTSTGAHLHFGMLFEGSYVDPEDYVDFS